EDEIGSETAVALPGFATPDSFERFRAKARAFLKDHEDHIAIRKLRINSPLTPLDLQELERMLTASGVGSPDHLEKAKAECSGFGLFVRSMIGLDREAAKQALAGFLSGKTLTSNQIEFVDLTEAGSGWQCRLSTSSILFKGLPIEEACGRIAALGFEAVDIWSAYDKCPHLDDAATRLGSSGLKALLAKHHLQLCAFSIYIGG